MSNANGLGNTLNNFMIGNFGNNILFGDTATIPSLAMAVTIH